MISCLREAKDYYYHLLDGDEEEGVLFKKKKPPGFEGKKILTFPKRKCQSA